MHLVRHFEKFRPQYDAVGVTTFIPQLDGQQFCAEEMARHIRGMGVVIAGDDEIDSHVLDAGAASGLRAVVKWGIGTDGIDKSHAARLGIPVFNTPGAFGEEVGDLAISHLLMLARKTHLMDQSVRHGGWLKAEGRTISGLTAGVVGLGSIGRAIARRVAAFGMTVLGCDLATLNTQELAGIGTRQVSFDDVLAAADVLIVACTLTAENRHMIGRETLGKVKHGILLINVSRGPLVDEVALAEALEDGRVAGAGLDVFENEPLPAQSPLRAFADRCTFSTHNGSNTTEAVARINQMTTEIAFEALGLKKASFQPNRVA